MKSAAKSKATPADAQVVMQLYEIRREPEMRKARNHMALKFNPQSLEEMLQLVGNFGEAENAYFRQVTSYWDMAASLVRHGAVHEGLFMSWATEMFFMWAKIQPYAAAYRKAVDSATFMSNVEALVEGSKEGREKRIYFQDRIRKRLAAARATGKA